MIQVAPITLEGHGVRLEPLTAEHRDALGAAVADGRLWELWFTAVAAPRRGKITVSLSFRPTCEKKAAKL